MNIDCPHCGQTYEVDDSFAGCEVQCQKCGGKFFVGAASGFPERQSREFSRSPSEDERKRSFPLKNLIGWLALLAVIGGFVLIMRGQSINREIRQMELKKEREIARRQQEERQRKVEQQRDLERRQERERQERERLEAEKQRAAEREKQRAEQETRQAEQEKRRAMKNRRHELENRRNQLTEKLRALNDRSGKNALAALPEAKEKLNELERVSATLNDPRYQCFDFCVKFNDDNFARRVRKRGTYTCERHNVTWTGRQLEKYEHEYVRRSTLEDRKRILESSLSAMRREAIRKLTREAAELKTELARLDAELAALDAVQKNAAPAEGTAR